VALADQVEACSKSWLKQFVISSPLGYQTQKQVGLGSWKSFLFSSSSIFLYLSVSTVLSFFLSFFPFIV
jgi:hypothetical protein